MHTQHIRYSRFGSATFHPPHIFAKAKKKNLIISCTFFVAVEKGTRKFYELSMKMYIRSFYLSHSPSTPSYTVLFSLLTNIFLSFLFRYCLLKEKEKKNNKFFLSFKFVCTWNSCSDIGKGCGGRTLTAVCVFMCFIGKVLFY